ncbi:hypothetical protein F3Y22_tig00110187pilonHSYRG00410 [Hibiscus syriacus]|uniref:alanine--tRNA ligase n=1 Tax=Hibiscus syriacus TaxID=106335 RepID=A0A6A3BIX4_HIBSY|nr:hypothetical protein F3Y22_tig00110187pilonHSYRG00410 [Hibiscus syriacus]
MLWRAVCEKCKEANRNLVQLNKMIGYAPDEEINRYELMAEERGLIVDVEGFNNAMDEARENFSHHESAIKAIYTGSEFVESATAGDDVGIVLESTSFYAEQGGQIFDIGSLDGPFGSFQVCNVQIFGGFVLLIGSLSGVTGKFSVGDKVTRKVDYDRRTLIAPNHTCTHMLNHALREVLGNHVDQKGSIVLPKKLRFDFSHDPNRDGAINADHLRKIESIVNEQIKSELDVYSKEVTLAEAKLVAIGKNVEDLLADPENKEWSSISSELCGGISLFKHLLFYLRRESLKGFEG